MNKKPSKRVKKLIFAALLKANEPMSIYAISSKISPGFKNPVTQVKIYEGVDALLKEGKVLCRPGMTIPKFDRKLLITEQTYEISPLYRLAVL